jgi:hypothetical protein
MMTFAIDRLPTIEEGFPIHRSETVKIEISPTDAVTPEQMKVAAKDAEIVLGLMRDYPDDMRSFYNDIVAGRTETAKETATRIGLSESSFKQQGGGMWPFILGVGVIIMGCAITGLCESES